MICVEFVAEYIVLENAFDETMKILHCFKLLLNFIILNVCLFTWDNMVGRNKVT